MREYVKAINLYRKHYFTEQRAFTSRRKCTLADEAVLGRLWDAYWQGGCMPMPVTDLPEIIDVEPEQVDSCLAHTTSHTIEKKCIRFQHLDGQYQQANQYSEHQAARRRKSDTPEQREPGPEQGEPGFTPDKRGFSNHG